MAMEVKICGLRHPAQAQAIAALGFTTLGFICVETSPRYVSPKEIQSVLHSLTAYQGLLAIGVFANVSLAVIGQFCAQTNLNGIQLHGDEPPDFCLQVKREFPQHRLIKALRLRRSDDLQRAEDYYGAVDVLLLDAYHPEQLGGTGQTLPWQNLQRFQPPLTWWLAGGLTPANVGEALKLMRPDGIDLSSGVERAPADKDLAKVTQLRFQLDALPTF
ncbi:MULTISPECIES: phosphoribosylanthranilate isomerase [unclassified Synechocystis]|uniref:phosphoribosylanthranilate isomerase n=1 Tax=unclassified Synechocystis TaxID=2640012 RepID=UPI00040A42EB|nr:MULTISPECIES: phosphoribosylanthranilate isomerase [unclassified Synechocystis]AIE75904.1 Phosphoribosylanthranilate isomerase [Synechocystis sp. PCC 6714]MCT0255170.1 phosphoribosylanthranilate isomerase [Synechocystis sp. CS-94]